MENPMLQVISPNSNFSTKKSAAILSQNFAIHLAYIMLVIHKYKKSCNPFVLFC